MTRFVHPSRILRGFALGGAAIVLLAACSSSGSTPTPAPTAAPTEAPSAAPSAASPAATESPAASSAGEAYEVKTASGSVGSFLTGEDGKTLYVFKKDTAGTSNCSGQCATNWPPFTIESSDTLKADDGVTGKLATITRADGTMQVTYNGAPLYYFAADKSAGDTNGQGVGGVWFVAAP
jgi:predicted lipoprotein with Yx(FWY)xxD motif